MFGNVVGGSKLTIDLEASNYNLHGESGFTVIPNMCIIEIVYENCLYTNPT